MAETVLPGVTIEVRAEGLIVPLGITVGNLGVVGTASKGPVNVPTILGSFSEAQEVFGDYDPWINGTSNELTLVRALEIAFNHGATTAIAVRVAEASKQAAGLVLKSTGGDGVTLEAKTEGTWGNDIEVAIGTADANAFIEAEDVVGPAFTLANPKVVKSSRNRIRIVPGGGGLEQSLEISYDQPGPGPGQVNVPTTGANAGKLEFNTAPAAGDKVVASYVVESSAANKVTVRYRNSEEVYTVVSGKDLENDLKSSALVKGTVVQAHATERLAAPLAFTRLAGGKNGAGATANYSEGLEKLSDQDAHIIVAAGQDENFGATLKGHCELASSDTFKRDRIAVVGSGSTSPDATIVLNSLLAHNLNSDRLIFVGPGIKVPDRTVIPTPEKPSKDVVLPGSYAAAAIAGMLGGSEPHTSPTNKLLSVNGLQARFTLPQLRQLVQARILALEVREGFRIVKGITTSTDTAWHQITTRRIVDFAKAGVRSAANPFIGKLNNERVRGALRTSINSFLSDMVDREMLISYDLDVSATRQQEIRGIVRVTMVLRPTFSIDFIQVTIFLE